MNLLDLTSLQLHAGDIHRYGGISGALGTNWLFPIQQDILCVYFMVLM